MDKTSWYVRRGKLLFRMDSYAAALRESNTDAGGTVTDHIDPDCNVVPIDKTTAGKEPMQTTKPAPDGVIPDQDILPPIDELSDDWDVLQMAGLQASEGQERRRWYLGDLAQKVIRRYGQKSLNKFAGDVKIPKTQTLRDYERVSRYYDPIARAEYPSLTWSHFREAMKATDIEDAMEWLGKAADMNWTVVTLGQAIDKKKGKTVKVNHKYDAIPVSYGQGRITLGTADLDVKDYLERLTEGRAREDFAVTIVVSWLEREEPLAA